MSNPSIVTDSSPKFLLGIQRDVMSTTNLDTTIKANEQLELRGSLTIYNRLTISGKLYITQEMGF